MVQKYYVGEFLASEHYFVKNVHSHKELPSACRVASGFFVSGRGEISGVLIYLHANCVKNLHDKLNSALKVCTKS